MWDSPPKKKRKIGEYDIILTCSACPEQYDVYKAEQQIGYLRLRHGEFTINIPDAGGLEIYAYHFDNEKGQFEDQSERDLFLTKAIAELQKNDPS